MPEASIYDAIFTSVADEEGAPFEEVAEVLTHREVFDDYFYTAWDHAVSDARALFRRVTGRPEPTETTTVYVVAFQHKTPGEGVGGFDWFYTREDAEKAESARILDHFYGAEYEHAVFPYEVPSDLSREETTRYIDSDYIDALCEAVKKGPQQ